MSASTILIVEDEAIVAMDLAGKLERLGYTVLGPVDRGEEAIELARQHRPSLPVIVMTYGSFAFLSRYTRANMLEVINQQYITTARSKGSTGLGLHIVFNIVTRTLGGTITCSSVPGQGTTFEMYMPISREDS